MDNNHPQASPSWNPFTTSTQYRPTPYTEEQYLQASPARHAGPVEGYTVPPDQATALLDDGKEEEWNGRTAEGKLWREGFWIRFPVVSFCCLLVILGSLAGVIAVLLLSDGKNIAAWDSKTIKIAEHRRTTKIGVSAWISIINFIMGQALVILFTEAVALGWWIAALKGQTLRRLHLRWEVGMSAFKMIQRWSFGGWFCIASIAFTVFAGLEALLQAASSARISVSSTQVNAKATMANGLPAGFSGVIASVGHDSFGTVYYTPTFVDVLQNYTTQFPIHLDIEGCPSNPSSSCAVTFPGVGFQYTCTASRATTTFNGSIEDIEDGTYYFPNSPVFEVSFQKNAWSILLNAAWKDKLGTDGLVLATRNCTLVPAIVEYNMNVTQGIVTLQSPTSTVKWTSNSTDNNNQELRVDRVLETLPMLQYDKSQDNTTWRGAGTHSTLGGLGLALSRLFDSSILVKKDPTNFGARVTISGSFVAPYAQFANGTQNEEIMSNTFASPMDELLSNIRDIMFRSTVTIAQRNVTEFVITSDSGVTTDKLGSYVPVKAFNQTATYSVYETVYRTNRRMLVIGVGSMLLAILAILPLYWGFWRLGRNVTVSPIEVAKALHYSTVRDRNTGIVHPHSVLDAVDYSGRLLTQTGSNYEVLDLLKLLGNAKVRYGEVAPHILGVGFSEHTGVAKRGEKYV